MHDLLGVRGCIPPPSTGLMGCWEGNAIFHDKAKNIRDAMKYIKHYSNLSSLKCSNVKYSYMVITKLCMSLSTTILKLYIIQNFKNKNNISQLQPLCQSRPVTCCRQCSGIIFIFALAP